MRLKPELAHGFLCFIIDNYEYTTIRGIGTMQAGYTCQRCLGSVRKPSRRLIRSFSASGPAYLSNSRESNLARFQRPVSSNLPSHVRSRRAVSSVTTQGQVPRTEPAELRSPPGLSSTPIPEVTGRPLLRPNNLFHPFSQSPSPEIRQRAAFIKHHAYCPHPSHHQTRVPIAPDDPEARKPVGSTSQAPAHVNFECPDCGIPVYCSEAHWADDYESHLEICDLLREINEDDHDLRSGRFFPEFEYPGPQMEEALVNMTNWDTFLYSREFRAINEARSMRQATRLLTYPVTIGSVLHELSPYNIRRGGRLTPEGLKSLTGEPFPKSGFKPLLNPT